MPDDPFGRCANCGAPLEQGVQYPVSTETEDGEFTLHSFCDAECQREWEAEADADGDAGDRSPGGTGA